VSGVIILEGDCDMCVLSSTYLFLVHLIEGVDDGLEVKNCTMYQSHTNMHIHTHTHTHTYIHRIQEFMTYQRGGV
jgi:hypothetical protein